MLRRTVEQLEKLAVAIFEKVNASPDDAGLVARLLVQADLMGLPSHGVLRIMQYLRDVGEGSIIPGAEIEIENPKPTIFKIDGGWNFGQVVASRATEIVIEAARENGMACAIIRNVRHIGRVGAYTEMAAEAGCLAIATVASGGEGHWVAPFGGRKGRMGTNPIAFAAPTTGRPISMDFSTSSVPEGKVRLLRDTGQDLPPDCLVDSEGHPSVDPADLYDENGGPHGAILPSGGSQGYKSFGLSLMSLALASLLGEPRWMGLGLESHSNNTWIMAIDIKSAMQSELFCKELDAVVEYVTSSPPVAGDDGPIMPGQREFETADRNLIDGIPIADGVWDQIVKVADSHGVPVE